MEKKASRSREENAECSNSDKLIDEKISEDCSRERLKRHRTEMAGRVWIPETWGQESLLKDWTDCTAFDKSLFPKGLMLAREALVQGCQRADAAGVITVDGSC